MDNLKLEIKKTNRGKGIFAKASIKKGEHLASFDGKILGWYSNWTPYRVSHAMQFAPKKWRLSLGIADKFNHSCKPNCGIKNLFDVVAMRDIKKGEELTWDYEMTEANESNWSMDCKCGTKSCRGLISTYKNLPLATRKKYKGYISKWLIDEYGK